MILGTIITIILIILQASTAISMPWYGLMMPFFVGAGLKFILELIFRFKGGSALSKLTKELIDEIKEN